VSFASSQTTRRLESKAFTLVELLVVIGLVAALSALLLGPLGGSSTSALTSAQAALAGTVTVARTNAIATGRSCRMMFHIDPTNVSMPSRYLRYVALQVNGTSGWRTLSELYLPDGIYFAPGDFSALPDGVFAEGADAWSRPDGTGPLRSSMLRSGQIVNEAVGSESIERWVAVSLSPIGTTGQPGDLVLSLGRRRTPGSFDSGDSPVELIDRQSICGISISSYGLAVLIHDQSGF
jgi:prepilin-type N-terminal cleavage/methylation domain-containing protein